MPDVSIGKFILELYVGGGTKVQTVALILDITLDYTFTLCRPCSDSCSTRNLTVYNPSLSSTFSNYTCRSSECPSLKDYISCSSGFCMYNYTDQYVSSAGHLGKDTFQLGPSQFSFVFGCGDVNTGNYGSSVGFLGLGFSGLSLLSQVNFKKFSYWFLW
jgi:Xylanase inhibitor N-terminal